MATVKKELLRKPVARSASAPAAPEAQPEEHAEQHGQEHSHEGDELSPLCSGNGCVQTPPDH
ncbi:hypothetical protein [Saccharothrix algeriensis]|uniref:Uncharacterized protein n=1 Tax=Saccharothrix algeriensis TaxID=173560 RepID=A0A8T8HYC5_9PSEU|nr:hypothetical protein [Saccharothrix algeriensis]MBM7815165.1 hypothetical protein [Saccharothrix algeriensis]QTR03407.1 hypothetical protein J7S33_31640 [Saccharothrix algeriensis]